MNCDILICNGRVVDGAGNPWKRADVAIQGDRIVAVASPGILPREQCGEIVDAAGHVVSPGFIDIQSHSIVPWMSDSRSLSKVTQGVTTEILGEMWTPAPFGGRRQAPFGWRRLPPEMEEICSTWRRFSDWFDYMEATGVSVNWGSFLGGGNVREWACGWDPGDPSADELDAMRAVTAETMEQGAFGVATALIYPPNSFSSEHELTEVARVVARFGGVYITHIRSEGAGLMEGLEEAIRIGEASSAPVEIYHLKATGSPNWEKMPRVIERINAARADGLDITADMYPYTASGTGLTVLLPDWIAEGGRLFERLDDPGDRARAVREMLEEAAGLHPDSARRDYVVPVGFEKPENGDCIGRNLEEIAQDRGMNWAETAIDLLRSEGQRISTFFFSMSEDNVRLQLRQPWIKISTDAGGLDPGQQTLPTHPRAYGTYPRVLGKYVRDEQVLSLEEAVRIMSSAVAVRLDIQKRGLLASGYYADVVIFDPESIGDRSTWTDTHQLSEGVRDVWVNGSPVLRDGQHTGQKPGRPLRPGSA